MIKKFIKFLAEQTFMKNIFKVMMDHIIITFLF